MEDLKNYRRQNKETRQMNDNWEACINIESLGEVRSTKVRRTRLLRTHDKEIMLLDGYNKEHWKKYWYTKLLTEDRTEFVK